MTNHRSYGTPVYLLSIYDDKDTIFILITSPRHIMLFVIIKM